MIPPEGAPIRGAYRTKIQRCGCMSRPWKAGLRWVASWRRAYMSRPGSQIYQTSLSTPRIVTNPWIILLVLAMGFFMILLDTTIVNVAIPSIIDGLHASLDQILWVLNAYLLVYAVLLITSGRLGDMFGPKKMFLSG